MPFTPLSMRRIWLPDWPASACRSARFPARRRTGATICAVPISDVDSIKVRRLLLGYVVTLKVQGSEFKLEANAAAGAKPMAEALERAKAEA